MLELQHSRPHQGQLQGLTTCALGVILGATANNICTSIATLRTVETKELNSTETLQSVERHKTQNVNATNIKSWTNGE